MYYFNFFGWKTLEFDLSAFLKLAIHLLMFYIDIVFTSLRENFYIYASI
jgi:hypothetical protein